MPVSQHKTKQHEKCTIRQISHLFLRVRKCKIFTFFSGLSWKYNHLPWHTEQRDSAAARLPFFSGDTVRYLDVSSVSCVKLFCIGFSVISLRKNVWVFAPNPLPQITQTTQNTVRSHFFSYQEKCIYWMRRKSTHYFKTTAKHQSSNRSLDDFLFWTEILPRNVFIIIAFLSFYNYC